MKTKEVNINEEHPEKSMKFKRSQQLVVILTFPENLSKRNALAEMKAKLLAKK